jgi:hypothetical protein
MAILGKDIKGITDIDAFLTVTNGPRAVAEAVMRSLLHNPGILWWAPERGHDLHQHLHVFFDQERIELAVRQQAEEDERVDSARASATLFGTELQLQVALTLTQNAAKVRFTLTIGSLGEVINAAVAG